MKNIKTLIIEALELSKIISHISIEKIKNFIDIKNIKNNSNLNVIALLNVAEDYRTNNILNFKIERNRTINRGNNIAKLKLYIFNLLFINKIYNVFSLTY